MARKDRNRNAADPRQTAWYVEQERRYAERRRNAYLAVLSTPAGRLVLGDLIGRTGAYETAYSQFVNETHRKLGRQEVGFELRDYLVELDEKLFLLMESELRAQIRRDEDETEAAHVPSATRGDPGADYANERTD